MFKKAMLVFFIIYVLVIGAIVVLAPVSNAELLSRSNAKLTPTPTGCDRFR